MNLLNKLTINNLKLNKKRTIVTIIGIILSTALITAVATMYSSMIKSLIKYETYEKGDFHATFYNVDTNDLSRIKNIRGVDEIYITKNIGYAYLKDSKNSGKPYAFIKSLDETSLNKLSIKLVEGRFPKKEGEILIPTHLKTNGRVDLKVGEQITLDIGRRIGEDSVELSQDDSYQDGETLEIDKQKTYKIVGLIERPATNIEAYFAPGYTFITYMNNKETTSTVDIYVKYTKEGCKKDIETTASILGIDKEKFAYGFSSEKLGNKNGSKYYNAYVDELEKAKYNFTLNSYLITLQNNPLEDPSAGSLGLVVLVVIIIIIITSVFCIKNSFDISITEKIKGYGMLKSLGATKKQIKNNVFYEATILGLIGIPLGLLSGLFASFILIIVSNMLLKNIFPDGIRLILSYSWESFLVAIVLAFTTIYLSARKSAKKASTTSPIVSIRDSAEIKIKSKNLNSPKLIKKIFGIGGEISYKNLKRNKKKYRTTIISIIISVSIFIALSYFIQTAFSEVKDEIKLKDYNISLHSYKSPIEFEVKARETTNLYNIEEYAIYKNTSFKVHNTKYNKEYLKYGHFGSDFENLDGSFVLVSIDKNQFKKYAKKLNLNYEEVKDKAILNDYEKLYYQDKKGNQKEIKLREFAFQKNDIINIYKEDFEDKNLDIEIAKVTDEFPFGLFFSQSCLIISEENFDKLDIKDYNFDIYYKSSNATRLQDDIDTYLDKEVYSLSNYEENARQMKSLYTLIAIFLYGFIIVISLIGITNIFNTITTNMELRRQEFAMLKSVGMTKNEFNNMIRLETIFMGFKALLLGIPLGIILSYIIYLAFNFGLEGSTFIPPFIPIIISIIVVYLLITILMKYSMSKINKQNTIETIRNENI